jgi:hypothetical protein
MTAMSVYHFLVRLVFLTRPKVQSTPLTVSQLTCASVPVLFPL